MSYVIGIDPPNGWAAWTEAGILAWGQAPDDGDFRDKRNALLYDIEEVIAQVGSMPGVVAIEQAFGGGRDAGLSQLKSLLKQADSGGWFEAKFDTRTTVVRPMANEWRSVVGVNGGERRKVNDRVVALAEKAVLETAGKPLEGARGGKREHAANAVLIAMSVWIQIGTWKKNPEDAYFLWTRDGRFGTKDQHEGGQDGADSRQEDGSGDRVADDGEAAVGEGEADRGADPS
jgi:hypothetical protein